MQDSGYELPRIPIPRTWVNKGLLDCLLALPGRIGTQPQRDVRGLHRLPNHPHQVVAQRLQVRLVSQLCGEGLEGLPSIVFPSVKAAVYERLYSPPEWIEQGRYEEGGRYHSEGGLLACEKDEDPLQHHNAAEVQRDQRDRQ